MKLCCFFNYGPHYRLPVFKALDGAMDVDFYLGREVEGMSRSGIEPLDVTQLRSVRRFSNVKWGKWLWRRKLLRLAFKPYDAYLLTADMCLTYVPFMLLCRMMGKRVYGWGHGIKGFRPVSRWLQRFLYRHYDALFIYSGGGRRRMGELGFDTSRIHVIYNSLNDGVTLADVERNRRDNPLREHFGNDLPVVLFTGRLTAVKRLDMLVDAVAACRVPCNLLVVGDGPCRDALERQVADRGLQGRVWFYGACHDRARLDRLLSNCAVCVSPGNVGLTALDAMGCGVPVVTHDDFESQMPEYEIVTPGVTGQLFTKDSPRELLTALEAALAMDRQATTAACLAAVNSHYTASRQVALIKNVIEQGEKTIE